MTVLITGGAGFIGSNLAGELVSQGESVRVIDDLSTGRRVNLEGLLGDVDFVEGSILDLDVLSKACEGVDYVLHQAAIPSVPRSVNDPITSHQANTTGTLNVLVAAKDTGVKRVVYASSSSAYGDTPILPKREDMKPDPLSPYAVSKLCGEYYCKVFYGVYGLETVALRYFNVFGPNQDPNSQYAAVVPKFIMAYKEGKPPVIFGDGEQSRDFTFIENVVAANIAAMKAEETRGDVVNIACGDRVTVNELASLIGEIMGVHIKPVHDERRKGDVLHSHADISAAKKLLGYEPKFDLREGLRKTCEWYLSK